MNEFYLYSSLLLILSIIISFIYFQEEKKTGNSYSVIYSNRKLIVDNVWVIASFRAGSLNCEIFEYLYKNKNRNIDIDELEKNVFRGRTVHFSKILDSMGIRGEIKSIFFTYTNNSIIYHPEK